MAAARVAAFRFAGEILAHEAGPDFEAQKIEVTDSAGLILYTIDIIVTASPAIAARTFPRR